jgi:hypothetical protein
MEVMIMLMMCRESRKIFDELNRQASINDVQGIITPAHVYICDRLICEYYTAPMINILKQRIKSIKKKEWKHFTIEYWEPVIRKTLKNVIGTHRDVTDIGYDNQEAFTYVISNYLIADYSISDAVMLNRLVNNTPLVSIKYACEEAKKYGVREIRYINAIIDKEKAKQEEKVRSISMLSDRISQSDRLMQRQTHTHTMMDIASAQYNYEQAKQNAELERKFMEAFGND